MCLSLVRHMSHVFQFLTQNTDFAFATARTLQPMHLACIPSSISLFCIDPDDFQEIIWNRWKICSWWFDPGDGESKSYSAVVCSISYANVCEHCKVGVAMFRNILVSYCLIMSLN